MYITNLSFKEVGEQIEISAMVGDFRLWYRFPSDCFNGLAADPFLAAGFFPAARTGETIKFDPSVAVSPRLRGGIKKLQEIFSSWRSDLHSFEVEAETAVAKTGKPGVCAFFSGGVDGLYTLGLHEEEITDLIYINGFDFEMSQEEFSAGLARVRKLAALYGKSVMPVETNFYEYNRSKSISRPWSHGSCLASIALAVGFSKCYIASSYTYTDLRPWGTHPLTDQLWSTEGTEIVHDSAALGRAEKIREVAKKPGVIDNLVVCWDRPDSNCGACSKCVRTMITLSILKIEGRNFPRQLTAKNLAHLDLAPSDPYVMDNLLLAVKQGDSEMEKALRRVTEPSPMKELIRQADKAFFQGGGAKVFRRLRAAVS